MEDFRRVVIRTMIGIGAYRMGQYVDKMESCLALSHNDLVELYATMIEGAGEETRREIDRCMEEDGTFLHQTLPPMLWHNVFVAVWSFFEHQVYQLTRDEEEEKAEQERKARKEPPVRGKPRRRKQYRHLDRALDDLVGRNLSGTQTDKLWAEVQLLKEIRNEIAHNGGRLEVPATMEVPAEAGDQPGASARAADKDTKRALMINSYINERQSAGETGLKLVDGMIAIRPEFCHEAIETFKVFLEQLADALPAAGPEASD